MKELVDMMLRGLGYRGMVLCIAGDSLSCTAALLRGDDTLPLVGLRRDDGHPPRAVVLYAKDGSTQEVTSDTQPESLNSPLSSWDDIPPPLMHILITSTVPLLHEAMRNVYASLSAHESTEQFRARMASFANEAGGQLEMSRLN